MRASGNLTKMMCACGKYMTMSAGKNVNGISVYKTACWKCIQDGRANKKTYCESCGYVPDNKGKLDVDHIDGNKSNNDESNLQTLCRPCHINKTVENKEYLSRRIIVDENM